MPLTKSGSEGAFKQNVHTLLGEVGQSPHVKSRAQALAIAYDIKRRNKAEGGSLSGMHVGAIRSQGPGRTDIHDMDVPSGAYVIPAECVSNLGENNTEAGLAKLEEVMHYPPDKVRRFFNSRPPTLKERARGGSVHDGRPVPIRAAGGEFVVPTDKVAEIGYGDTGHGHAILDQWVMAKRKEHIKTLKGLKPPAKD